MDLTLAQAMRLELRPEELLETATSDLSVSVSSGDWLRQVREKMSNPLVLHGEKPDMSFHGEFRSYQQTGFDWLKYMMDLKLGACLADDMGLGKTVQIKGSKPKHGSP